MTFITGEVTPEALFHSSSNGAVLLDLFLMLPLKANFVFLLFLVDLSVFDLVYVF